MIRTTPIKTAEQITQEKGFFHTPFFIAPNKTVFSERAARFNELALADKSDWRAYLELLAHICEAQQAIYESHLDNHQTRPDSAKSAFILPAADGSLIPANTQETLLALLVHLGERVNPQLADALQTLTKEQVEQIAGFCLGAEDSQLASEDKAYTIWLQAALQIIWTTWAYQLQEDDVPPVEERSHCPCCGTEAVASVIMINSEVSDLRYMHCPNCNSQWNALRAKCTFCGDQSAITLQSIEGAKDGALKGARAETCDHCHAYRKLFTRREQQYADPIADDLASLALDILVGEDGYHRGGHNPFLLDESDDSSGENQVLN